MLRLYFANDINHGYIIPEYFFKHDHSRTVDTGADMINIVTLISLNL